MTDEVAERRECEETESAHEAGDLLISYLEQLGVEYLFGIPGGAIEPLYNALARSEQRGGIKSVVARHETGAAFMAEGYALIDEKEKALDWLDIAVKCGNINYPMLSSFDPFLVTLRSEERFQRLIENVKYQWDHFEV